MKLLSLAKLAKREDVHQVYLRKVVGQFKRGEIQDWRGYKFFGWSACWLAYKDEPDDLEIDV